MFIVEFIKWAFGWLVVASLVALLLIMTLRVATGSYAGVGRVAARTTVSAVTSAQEGFTSFIRALEKARN